MCGIVDETIGEILVDKGGGNVDDDILGIIDDESEGGISGWENVEPERINEYIWPFYKEGDDLIGIIYQSNHIWMHMIYHLKGMIELRL